MICRSKIVSANTIGHSVAVQMITPHSATSAFRSLAKFLPGSVEYFCSFQPKVKGRVTVSAFWNIGGDSHVSPLLRSRLWLPPRRRTPGFYRSVCIPQAGQREQVDPG